MKGQPVRTHAPLRTSHPEWTTRDVVETIKPFVLGFGLAAVPLGVFVLWLVS
jgi:uncharacterized membrane protein